MDEQICEAYALIAKLGIALGVAPLNKHDGCWECVIDDQWKIALNGHKEPKVSSLNQNPIEPFHCFVDYNGWPAGVLTPYGGVIAAGATANEDAFIAALQAKIASVSPSPHGDAP